jgi:hypothetical protein
MTDAVEQRAAESQGVLAFDVCAYNNARSVGRRVGRLGESVGVSLDAVDVQTYYAATFDAPLRAGAAV